MKNEISFLSLKKILNVNHLTYIRLYYKTICSSKTAVLFCKTKQSN